MTPAVAAASLPFLLYRTKRAVITGLERGGGLDIVRWITRRTPRILTYHRFGPKDTLRVMGADNFERQIVFLKSRFRIVPLGDLAEARRAGGAVPANTVAITVDDGYEDFYKYAFPVLKRHGVPATLFVVSRFAAGEIWLWPDLIQYAVERSGRRELTLDLGPTRGRWSLESVEDRFAAWSDIADHCLTLGPEGTRDVTTALLAATGVEAPSLPPPLLRAASWDQIREMAAGGIEIGSHTRSHPRLTLLSQEELRDEIGGSKGDLEAQISRPVTTFAYPNGREEDFDDRCKHELAAAGYSCAVAGYYAADVLGDAFSMKRLSIDTDWNDFLKAVCGMKHLALVVRR
jgi:peptidoglycan/xylan/chitin deacetylase (PgdA/CDA1 family)